MAGFLDKFRKGWNAFVQEDKDYLTNFNEDFGMSTSLRPDRVRLSFHSGRDIVSSIYTRLGIDVASIEIRHSKIDKNRRFLGDIQSGLNECLTIEANVDQTGRALRQDMAMTLFDKGVIAIVPVDTTTSPKNSNSFDIQSLRVGEVVEWFPRHVKVKLYNDRKGTFQEVTVAKTFAAIVENPLYSIMNEPNSTLQRLIRKLNLLDIVDEQASSGKLDLIIQLPYTIKSQARREQAEQRRKDIEVQLKGSKYGIAYTDGTERITQLNRPAENTLLKQIDGLTEQLYSQLGLTPSIFDGTASEAELLNYHNRTIEPVVAALADAMRRTFLTKTARSQGQTVNYFRDPFKLVPVGNIAEIADKFTRNEILSSNEIRSIIGFKPSDDPRAEELRNSNMPAPKDEAVPQRRNLDPEEE